MSEAARVRAKFKCVGTEKNDYNPAQTTYKFNAVAAGGTPENERFHRFTPLGTLTLTVDNPVIDGFYKLGRKYYLDFTFAAD